MLSKNLWVILVLFASKLSCMPRAGHRVTCAPYASGQNGALQSALYDLINRAKESICVSIFTFRDLEFARRLALAQVRGVKVKVIMDASSCSESYGIYAFLKRFKVLVLKYEASNSINHNKYVVVDGKTTWMGSMNFTKQAYERNRESAILIFSRQVANFYAKNFKDTEEIIEGQMLKEEAKKREFEERFAQEKAKHLQAFKYLENKKSGQKQ